MSEVLLAASIDLVFRRALRPLTSPNFNSEPVVDKAIEGLKSLLQDELARKEDRSWIW
jgi:hypothetical protein